jgi:hypothetical protein
MGNGSRMNEKWKTRDKNISAEESCFTEEGRPE